MWQNILIKIAINVLPELFEIFIHAMQDTAHKDDNDLNDMDVAKIVKNKDIIVKAMRHKKR